MSAKVCGHHCVFVCSPNLGARVPLRGENLYGVRERVDVQLPLGFRRNSRIRPLKKNHQCTETRGDSSVTTVAWIPVCSNLRSIGDTEFIWTSGSRCQSRSSYIYAKTYSFANNPKTTVYANGRLLPTWLHRKAVLARTRNSFGILMKHCIAVSSSCLQLGMLSGCCFHTLDRSRSRVS